MVFLRCLELDAGFEIDHNPCERPTWPQVINEMRVEPTLRAFYEDGSVREFNDRATIEKLIVEARPYLTWKSRIGDGRNAGLPCPSLPPELT